MEQNKFVKYGNLPPLITGKWTLSQLENGEIGTPKNGLNVFSCFHCGGGQQWVINSPDFMF